MSRTSDPGTGSGTTPKTAPKQPASQPALKRHHKSGGGKQTVAHVIADVARSLGIPPAVALALGMYESGLDPRKPGDKQNGQYTSFGIYQLHEGGELGSHSAEWAYNVRNNATTALSVLAQVHHQHPDWDWGRVAAAAQRPADQAAEASAVNGYLAGYHNSGAANPVEYFISQSATAGAAAGAGAGGAPAGNADFSKADLRGMLDDLGLPRALIESNASLQKAFNQIVSQKLALDTDAGKARAMAIFKNTDWWKNHNATQRKMLTMHADDPSQYARLMQQSTHHAQDLANQLGIHLNAKTLGNVAHIGLFNGLDDNELTGLIARHFEYHRNGVYGGEAGTDINAIEKMASEYYVNLPDGRVENMVTRMLSNGEDPTTLTDFFQKQALSRFPHLKQQFDQGLTVADVAAPYVGAMSNLLETPTTAIKPHDSTIMKALQASDGKGGFQLMPEWQFEQMLRNDPRWLKTQNAQNSLMDVGTGLLRQMGLMV